MATSRVFIIDVVVINAYVLYREYVAALPTTDPPSHHPAAQSQKAFRRALMHALVGTYTSRKKSGRGWEIPKVRADEPQHIPQLHRPKSQPCVVCAKTHSVKMGGNKPRTREGCATCEVAVHIACWRDHLPLVVEEEEKDSD